MTPEISDAVVVVKAYGTAELHLADQKWFQDGSSRTLCGLGIRPVASTTRYRTHGCHECAERALAAGFSFVAERDRAALNLARFCAGTANVG